MATIFTSLNIFRIIQGAGGGLLTPVRMARFRTFSPRRKDRDSRFIILPIAVGTSNWVLSRFGFFVDQMSWRWTFYINLPFGIVALLFGLLFLAEHVEKSAGRFWFARLFFTAPGFAMLYIASARDHKRVDFSQNYEYWIAGVYSLHCLYCRTKGKARCLDYGLY